LLGNGYRFLAAGASFNGARLLKIESDERSGAYVMPYLDNGYGVDDSGDYFRMSRNGELSGSETQGWIMAEPEEPEEPAGWCERCEDRIEDEYDMRSVATYRSSRGYWNTETWCEYCADNHTFTCEGFDEVCSDDVDHVEVDDSAYSLAYAEENFRLSDYSGDWFDPENDPSVEMDDGDTWMESEFEKHGFVCAITERNLPVKERHAEWPEIGADCDDEDIAAWMATREVARIEDARQEEFAV
jgi:hypothetical protein